MLAGALNTLGVLVPGTEPALAGSAAARRAG